MTTTSKLPPAILIAAGGAQHVLDKEQFSIGRIADNDLAIDDKRVSRRHAQVRREDFRYFIEDLGSTNGTWLNGARLSAESPLRNGDRVQIADVVLVFNDPNTTTRAESFQALSLDEARGQVVIARQTIPVTPKELALLRLLLDHAGELCSKDMIARAVWPEYEGDVADYNIEGLISRLRRKIEPDPDSPVFLRSQRGLGYMLVPTAVPPQSNSE